MARLTYHGNKTMPRINIKQLGLTPEQAKNTFGGLKPEEIGKKVEELQGAQAMNQQNVETFTDKVNALNEAKSNKYKSMAVGPEGNVFAKEGEGLAGKIYQMAHPFKNIANKLTGGKRGFIADIENITSKETLDNLIAIKAAGGTFGALSEKELQMLIDSATKIGNWKVENDKGEVIGYDIGEKLFDNELKRLQQLAEKAIVQSGGSVNTGQTSSGIKYTIE